MYERIGTLTSDFRDRLLSEVGEWRHKLTDRKNYWLYAVDGSRRYIKLEPGGFVHPHADTGRPKIHWVLKTNPDCVSRWGGEDFHLEELGIYIMDPKTEHESFNNGDTERIHLIFS